MFLKFILFLGLLSTLLFALNQQSNILLESKIYIDKNNVNNFNYILKNSNKVFKPNQDEVIHLGYSTDAVWLKFSINNTSDSQINKVLEISNHMLDDVILYVKEADGSFKKEIRGVLYRKNFNDNILKMYFNISIKPKEIKNYYLKASSLSSGLYFKINLINKNELYQKEIKHQLILTLFFGAMIALLIYNIFLFLFTKELLYLYYTMYMAFTTWNHVSYSALGLYILPFSFIELDVYLVIFYLAMSSIFSFLFIREFLNLKKFKKIDFSIKIIIAINILFILTMATDYYPLSQIVSLMIFSLIYLLFILFFLLYKKDENVKLILAGWTIATFGWLVLGTYQYGVFDLLYHYPYIYETSIFTEAILFSIALSKRLNKTKVLENLVATNEILTQELHHRVKNNMQLIISMYRLKLSKYTDINISNSLKESEVIIQAISNTHEILYSQQNISTINAQTYIKALINSINYTHSTSDIKIVLDVTTTLNANNSIYVGIILNELITNAYKYSKCNEINISFSKKDKTSILIIQDNGIGYDINKPTNGFGIELVNTLANEELKAKCKVDTKNGTCYHLVWN